MIQPLNPQTMLTISKEVYGNTTPYFLYPNKKKEDHNRLDMGKKNPKQNKNNNNNKRNRVSK